MADPVLSVRNLKVDFPSDDGDVHAVDDLSFEVHRNEVLGIVGESGSGKSVTSMAIMGLLPKRAKISGEVRLGNDELLAMNEAGMRAIRGKRISMVFQDALAALNPVYTVGDQVGEAIEVHNEDINDREVKARVIDLLDLVGIPSARQRVDQYPHEYSGGMRQRAMIAMALANDPDLLIADEPTTALDVTIQAQVLDVFERIQERTSSSIVLITHDLGVVAGMADRVMVMYAGRQAELGTVEEIFYEPRHPYTLSLLASIPRVDRGARGDRLYRIKGQPPSLLNVPPGCAFHPRCPFAVVPEPCATDQPAFRPIDNLEHRTACHFAEQVAEKSPEELRQEASV